MPVDLDYYAILNLKPGSSAEEVRDQWRRLAKAYHPDKHAGDRRFEEQLRLINLAYEVLRDPQRKAAYDLRFPPEPPPVRPAPKPAGSTSPKPPPKSTPPKPPQGVKPNPARDIPRSPVPAAPVFRRRRSILALGSAAAVLVLLLVWQLSTFLRDSAAAPPVSVRIGAVSLPSVPGESIPVPSPGTDDEAQKIAAERAREAQQLAALKAPLVQRYGAALPRINALIAQSDSLCRTNNPLSTPAVSADRSEQGRLLAHLAADTKLLRSARDQAQSSLDEMQWYGTAGMWASQAQEVSSDLQELEALQPVVSADIGALSRSSPMAPSALL